MKRESGRSGVMRMPPPPARLVYRTIYHSQLGQVYDVDEEYRIYANSKTKQVAEWTTFEEEDLRVTNVLEVSAVGLLFVSRSWESLEPGNLWEEKEVALLKIVPPAEPDPEPRSLYFDATKLGLSVECIYLEELGQVKIVGRQMTKGRKIATWYDDYNNSGCFRNELYSVRRKRQQLLLERTWEAWWPYSGSGKQIYVISIPSTP
jgi:hypothetical protein